MLLRGFLETMRHSREYLEFPVCHGLKRNFKGESGRRGINFDVLGPEVPEVVGKDDRGIESLGPGLITFR